MSLLKKIIKTKLALTSRAAASAQIRREAELTVRAAEDLGSELAGTPSTVPRMPGVDEDMRNWSVLQIIEHNVIVNRVFTEIIDTICQGQVWVSDRDPKKDVMPSETPSFSIVKEFTESVNQYLVVVEKYPKLRGIGSFPHPVFGQFDAHMTHAMTGFHLWIHRRQADVVVKQLRG